MKNLVYLINAGSSKSRSVANRIQLPTTLLYLATFLHNDGFEIRMIDRMIEQCSLDELDMLLKRDSNHILMIVIHFSTKEIPEAINIADRCKVNVSEAATIAFGLHATMYPYQVLEDQAFDILIKGDGEPGIVALAQALQAGQTDFDIPNVWSRTLMTHDEVKIFPAHSSASTELDTIPLPEYRLLPMELYLHRNTGFITGNFTEQKMIRISTSRGCIHKCIFCSECLREYKRMGNKAILRHLDNVVSHFDPDIIFFEDADFFAAKESTLRLLDAIEKHYRFLCIAVSRAEYYHQGYISLGLINRLALRWCVWDVGGETGNERWLKNIRKGVSLNQLRTVADYTGEVGVRAGFSFMVGLPGETEYEMLETLFFMEELRERAHGNISITYQYYQPIGRTMMTNIAGVFGFQSPRTLRDWPKLIDPRTGSIAIYHYPWIHRPEFINYLMMVVKYELNRIYPQEEEEMAKLIRHSWKNRKEKNDWSNLTESSLADELDLSFFTPREEWISKS